ncbi:protein-tyrosine phosphatase [Bacillus fengqiuensis]|nr:protein-tyrosine phosphatase [Bacillus fengqiuensis]
MTEKKTYQSLHEDKIFIGGQHDVEALISDEKCEVIIDLRAESAIQDNEIGGIKHIHVPLIDQQEGQEQQIQQAVNKVVEAYKAGKKVAFHCAAGRSRTGSVAIGTLLSLGISSSVEDAEKYVKRIRPEVNIHPLLRQSVQKVFPIDINTDK